MTSIDIMIKTEANVNEERHYKYNILNYIPILSDENIYNVQVQVLQKTYTLTLNKQQSIKQISNNLIPDNKQQLGYKAGQFINSHQGDGTLMFPQHSKQLKEKALLFSSMTGQLSQHTIPVYTIKNKDNNNIVYINLVFNGIKSQIQKRIEHEGIQFIITLRSDSDVYKQIFNVYYVQTSQEYNIAMIKPLTQLDSSKEILYSDFINHVCELLPSDCFIDPFQSARVFNMNPEILLEDINANRKTTLYNAKPLQIGINNPIFTKQNTYDLIKQYTKTKPKEDEIWYKPINIITSNDLPLFRQRIELKGLFPDLIITQFVSYIQQVLDHIVYKKEFKVPQLDYQFEQTNKSNVYNHIYTGVSLVINGVFDKSDNLVINSSQFPITNKIRGVSMEPIPDYDDMKIQCQETKIQYNRESNSLYSLAIIKNNILIIKIPKILNESKLLYFIEPYLDVSQKNHAILFNTMLFESLTSSIIYSSIFNTLLLASCHQWIDINIIAISIGFTELDTYIHLLAIEHFLDKNPLTSLKRINLSFGNNDSHLFVFDMLVTKKQTFKLGATKQSSNQFLKQIYQSKHLIQTEQI